MSDTAAKPRPQFRNIGLAQVAFSYRLPLAVSCPSFTA